MCTHQKHLDRKEEQSTYDQRKRDIDLYGYERAFKRALSGISYEKFEWQKNNNRLRGEI